MKSLLLAGGMFCLTLFSQPGVAAADCDNPKPFRFAQIPQISRDAMLKQYQPLYQHLSAQLKRKIEIVNAPSYNAVIEGLIDGSIDLAELGPAAYAQAKKRNADIVVFASFSGQQGVQFDLSKGYHAVLITRSDRQIDQLETLKGQSLSLVDPASTSGALYPRFLIKQRTGMALEHFFSRITFSGSHDRALEAVRSRQVDAAFIASTKLDDAIAKGKINPKEIKVVWQSEVIPLDPFVYRRTLCAPLIAALQQAFLLETAPLQAMFDQMQRPDGFITVNDENYRKIRELYDTVP